MNADQQISDKLEEVVKTNRLEEAYLVGTAETRSAEVDLYSGTTRHMSGFFHRLFNYVKIRPIPIITADKRPFHAVGKGDMYVYLPTRDNSNSC